MSVFDLTVLKSCLLLPDKQIESDLIAILESHATGPKPLLVRLQQKDRWYTLVHLIDTEDAVVVASPCCIELRLAKSFQFL